MTNRPYQVTILNSKKHMSQVYRRQGGGFTIKRAKAAKGHKGGYLTHFSRAEVRQIRKRAKRHSWTVEVSHGRRYPLIHKAPGAHWPTGRDGHKLLHAANEVARDLKRYAYIQSGFRTQAECEHFWRVYQAGGNLAANPWACGGKCCSNHARNKAIDAGYINTSGNYVSAGNYPGARAAMKRHGLCLPVGRGEVWHQELGNTWRS